MKVFTRQSIAAVHADAVHHIIWNHRDIVTEDGESTWESEPITLEVTTPLVDMIHPLSSYQQTKCDEYASQIINGVTIDAAPDKRFAYTYHERLYLKHQFDDIISRLSHNPETRRAVLYTWVPAVDTVAGDVPCLQMVQLLVRDGKLHMINILRSNDVLSASGPNMYGFVKLQKHIAHMLNVGMGTYTHIITVPHLYPGRDASDLKRWY